MTSAADFTDVHYAIAEAPSVVIATDFDGAMYRSGTISSTLQRLARCAKVTVAVLSERSMADVRSRFAVDAIFAAHQGLEIFGKQFDFVHPEAAGLAARLRDVCNTVQEDISGLSCVWVENERFSAKVHVRNCSLNDRPRVHHAIRRVLGPVEDLFSLRTSAAAFTILPRSDWDKGSALKYIERELGLEDVLTVCVADDGSDEAMFRAVTNGITIRISPSYGSEATYSLPNNAAALDLLGSVADTLESTTRRSNVCLLQHSALNGSAR